MAWIDLNCDLGEGSEHDGALMPLITSANIACGIHAGDVDTMRAAVELAHGYGVAIGAHPSLNDRANFGRKEMPVSPREVHMYVLTQTKLLQIITRQTGAKLTHVKPHGALYTMASRDPELADAVANAVYEVDPTLVLYGLAGGHLLSAGRVRGLQVASEVFADRTYQPDGSLTPRSYPGATITDEATALAQAISLARDGTVRAVGGTEITLRVDTICLHSDGADPVGFAQAIHLGLKEAGFWLRACGS